MAITEEKMIMLLEAQKQDILQGFNDRICVLEQELEETKKEAKKAMDIVIESQQQIIELTVSVERLQAKNQDLFQQLDDQVNRGMRKTIVFKGIETDDNEKTWENTERKIVNCLVDNADYTRLTMLTPSLKEHTEVKNIKI